ncbi:hypothetical protein NMG60_11028438 [Bertholletia excelsa]
MELPPGFRFHPTDEELIIHYLSPKVLDRGFTARAIGEVDLNKVEPWDLPWKAKMGEREWYFFCMRDRKYPTGLRTNRATDEGYWKATGKDKEIHKERTLIGMKKTLVFYRGRAPKGEKTNWVMHEYRLEGKHSLYKLNKTSSKNEWVICRVFRKSSGGKKTHISGLARMELQGGSNLPPLMECSDQTRSTGPNPEPPVSRDLLLRGEEAHQGGYVWHLEQLCPGRLLLPISKTPCLGLPLPLSIRPKHCKFSVPRTGSDPGRVYTEVLAPQQWSKHEMGRVEQRNG